MKSDVEATLVGLPLVARDDDTARVPPDVFTFSILSGNTLNGSQYFGIVPSTGQLVLTHAMDYVVPFLIQVRVVDSTGLSATAFVSVSVSNSNSRPLLTNIGATRLVPENLDGRGLAGRAHDPHHRQHTP